MSGKAMQRLDNKRISILVDFPSLIFDKEKQVCFVLIQKVSITVSLLE